MDHIKKQIDNLLQFNVYGSLSSLTLSKSKYAWYLIGNNKILDRDKEKINKLKDVELYYISPNKVMITSTKPEDLAHGLQERMLVIMDKMAKKQAESLEVKQELVELLKRLREI